MSDKKDSIPEFNHSAELSDADLENVAGGVSGPDGGAVKPPQNVCTPSHPALDPHHPMPGPAQSAYIS